MDFRDEIMAQIFDTGDATPKRTLAFCIEVTDESFMRGTSVSQSRSFSNWRRIGKLTFDNAVVSYNGDFVIHFNHPTWRDNRNDPSTASVLHDALAGRRLVHGLAASIRTAAGDVREVLVSAENLALASAPYHLLILQDITDRVRLENEESREGFDRSQ